MNAKSILRVAVAAMALLSNARLQAGSGSALDEVRALVETVDKKQRVECVSNLKQLAMAAQIWATQMQTSCPRTPSH